MCFSTKDMVATLMSSQRLKFIYLHKTELTSIPSQMGEQGSKPLNSLRSYWQLIPGLPGIRTQEAIFLQWHIYQETTHALMNNPTLGLMQAMLTLPDGSLKMKWRRKENGEKRKALGAVLSIQQVIKNADWCHQDRKLYIFKAI